MDLSEIKMLKFRLKENILLLKTSKYKMFLYDSDNSYYQEIGSSEIFELFHILRLVHNLDSFKKKLSEKGMGGNYEYYLANFVIKYMKKGVIEEVSDEKDQISFIDFKYCSKCRPQCVTYPYRAYLNDQAICDYICLECEIFQNKKDNCFHNPQDHIKNWANVAKVIVGESVYEDFIHQIFATTENINFLQQRDVQEKIQKICN